MSLKRALKSLYLIHEEIPESEREALYIPRPDNVVKRLATQLEMGRWPKILFAGQVGSGKTSELDHLARRVSGEYHVIRCGGDELADTDDPADEVELVFTLIRALANHTRQKVVRRSHGDIKKRLREVLTSTSTVSTKLSVMGVSFAGAKLKSSVTEQKTSVVQELRSYSSQLLINVVHEGIKSIERAAKKPALLIFDDLNTRSAFMEAEQDNSTVVDTSHLEMAIRAETQDFRRWVDPGHKRVISQVLADKEFDRTFPASLLNNLSVLDYWHRQYATWYDVNPLALPLVQRVTRTPSVDMKFSPPSSPGESPSQVLEIVAEPPPSVPKKGKKGIAPRTGGGETVRSPPGRHGAVQAVEGAGIRGDRPGGGGVRVRRGVDRASGYPGRRARPPFFRHEHLSRRHRPHCHVVPGGQSRVWVRRPVSLRGCGLL